MNSRYFNAGDGRSTSNTRNAPLRADERVTYHANHHPDRSAIRQYAAGGQDEWRERVPDEANAFEGIEGVITDVAV